MREEINNRLKVTIRDLLRIRVLVMLSFRCLFYCFFIHLLDKSINLGTSTTLLSIAACIGIGLSSLLALTRLTTYGTFLCFLLLFVLGKSGLLIINSFPSNQVGNFFWPVAIADHLSLLSITFFVSAATTWLAWHKRSIATIELLLVLVVSLELLGGHRNFHFDALRVIDDFAWKFGIQQITAIVILGASVFVLFITYAFASSLPFKIGKNNSLIPFESNRGKFSFQQFFISISFISILIWIICNQTLSYYTTQAGNRLMNGVGQEGEQGVSPLDFHSALGSSNQPAGIVRLDGDYDLNPYSPMLFLRESALSDFNGNQMVNASEIYDQDIPGIKPTQPYKGTENTELLERQPLQQSVYLLADHNFAFAADYPISISQIVNPQPKRFRATYKAYSMAPAFGAKDIHDELTGDASWSDEVWNHYLKPHKDKRYHDLALKITGRDSEKNSMPLEYSFYTRSTAYDEILEQVNQELFLVYRTNKPSKRERQSAHHAFTIANYLTKTAIYTLSPNHNLKPDEDPVAPFLFGDMRGYCVHFAHANVYMMRSLGIPSRIATGYLTDLQQSRDGHILLRMSDRHAWAEAYVEGRGWLPFDTQPEQVESHADSQIDMKLLEELMGLLGPSEEILPSDIGNSEMEHIEKSTASYLPEPKTVLWVMFAGLLLSLLLKMYIRYSFLLTLNPTIKTIRLYRAMAASFMDMGYPRMYGETRSEYKERISRILAQPVFAVIKPLNKIRYSQGASNIKQEIDSVIISDKNCTRYFSWKKRILAFLNPKSIVNFLSRAGW